MCFLNAMGGKQSIVLSEEANTLAQEYQKSTEHLLTANRKKLSLSLNTWKGKVRQLQFLMRYRPVVLHEDEDYCIITFDKQ